jgi:hypothetical protein
MEMAMTRKNRFYLIKKKKGKRFFFEKKKFFPARFPPHPE